MTPLPIDGARCTRSTSERYPWAPISTRTAAWPSSAARRSRSRERSTLCISRIMGRRSASATDGNNSPAVLNGQHRDVVGLGESSREVGDGTKYVPDDLAGRLPRRGLEAFLQALVTVIPTVLVDGLRYTIRE